MRFTSILSCLLAVSGMHAQPGKLTLPFCHSCELPPSDSLDVTGDGIPDLLVQGVLGESTCDIPVSYGGCGVVVRTLPGTMLLAQRHSLGGHDVCSFAQNDTIPIVEENIRDDFRIPRYGFIDGVIQALTWSYGRNGTAPPRLAHGADRVFVFAHMVGETRRYGTFTMEMIAERRTVKVHVGTLSVGREPVVVR